MLEPKHANAWFQWCNVTVPILFSWFCLRWYNLSCLILSFFDGQQIHFHLNLNVVTNTAPDPERKEEMTSTAHLLIVNRAADIHYILLKFPSIVENRSGDCSLQRLWTSGFCCALFLAREITFCRTPEFGRQQNLLSHLVSLL